MENTNRSHCRLDFIQEVVATDDATRTVTVRLKPDPKRYEWITKDGEDYLLDKFDRSIMSKASFISLLAQMKNKPIYYHEPKIKNLTKYYKSRKKTVRRTIQTGLIEFNPIDKSEEFLEQLETDHLKFVILSLDTVGSTVLANTIDPKTYALITSIIAYEISNIVSLFNGYVLKYTGDGIIAYFPEPSFISMNDLSVDCALSLRALFVKVLNPLFRINKLPTIDIRIGLDAGEAYVQTIGNPSAKQHKDIIGIVISLAAKIQAKAKTNEIYLGEVVERNLHISWRERCKEVLDIVDWKYTNHDGTKYKVYSIN
jgi:class 3 adenylate cyclase